MLQGAGAEPGAAGGGGRRLAVGRGGGVASRVITWAETAVGKCSPEGRGCSERDTGPVLRGQGGLGPSRALQG